MSDNDGISLGQSRYRSGPSDDIEFLLAGSEVESIAELKRLVDAARHAEEAILPALHGVASPASRGAAVRQPHGCEGQLQQ